MIKGYCECRRVQFEVDGEIEDFSHCHCSQCRRLHGAAFATFAGVAEAKFRYLSGEDEVRHYASSAGHDRTFCRVCGSNIYVALDAEPESLYLSMSTLVGEILTALGIRNICEVADAAKAFKELQHFSADVIIVDWHMQPLDGIDFVKMVRTAKDSPNPYVPIIMLSGFTEYRRVVEARDAGVNEFLAKPISAKALYQRFASIIDNPRPFIRTQDYFGPDRRRQNMGPPRGCAERRADARDEEGAGTGATA